MNPEQEIQDLRDQISNLSSQISGLLEWKKKKEEQQIEYPLDVASKNAIGAATGQGPGTTSLTQIYGVVGGGGGNVTCDRAFVTSVLVTIDGVQYELPSLI